MKTASIDVTKIDKSALYEGKTGAKYLSITLIPNKGGQDKWGNDGFIAQDLGKERRMKGEKGPILGNYKRVGNKLPHQQAPAQSQQSQAIPYDDDSEIPF